MVIPSRAFAAPAAVACAATAVVLTSCAPASVGRVPGAAADLHKAAAPVAPKLAISPSDGASGVALDTPVLVSSSSGRLDSVKLLKAGTASPLPGELSRDGRTWRSLEGFDSHANYTVVASASNGPSLATSAHSSFSTLTAQSRLLTTMSPDDGSTVGVGEPITLRFDDSIPAQRRAALMSHVQVVSDPPVIGAWHWFTADTVHFRPQDYWPSGTKVTVTANLKGFDVGDGTWGQGSWSSSFTVGAKHVSKIDDNTHTMTVYENDQLVHTWPVSMGKAGFRTIEGTLVVLYRVYKVKMNSCTTFGGAACIPGSANYYNEDVFYDTAISSDGYFIHAAPWSVYAQGRYDVSHGCVNLSTDRATTFYNWSMPGDVVVISNTGDPATAEDGEGDWQLDFSQYANTPGMSSIRTSDSNRPPRDA